MVLTFISAKGSGGGMEKGKAAVNFISSGLLVRISLVVPRFVEIMLCRMASLLRLLLVVSPLL
jgi:hypothetical protein